METIYVDFMHLHLMLSHIPIVGTMVATALYLLSFFVNTQSLRRSSLIIFVAMAFVTIPTFVTGAGAQAQLLDAPKDVVSRHLGSAQLTIWFTMITGTLAGIGLWQSGRMANRQRWNTVAVLAFSLVTLALVVRTGNTGGAINHPEVRSAQATSTELLMSRVEPSPDKFTGLILANKYWWAFMMFAHLVGLTALVATIGLLNLRVLGFAKGLPIAPLNRLVPLGLAGLGVNMVTGMLAFIGMAAYYAFNTAFLFKLGVLLLGLVTLMVWYASSAFADCDTLGPGEDAPLRAKIIAGASLVLWFLVIVAGRYIQSFENSISFTPIGR